MRKRSVIIGAGIWLIIGGLSGTAAFGQCAWDPAFGNPGVSGGTFPAVNALAVYDDGGGPALYIGGSFSQVGGVLANNIAKWNGSSWSALSFGVDAPVFAMTVYNDGTGPALYVGGMFTTAGLVTANRVAKWNGTSFSAVGGGTSSVVYALTTFNDGTGTALYVGGSFATVGPGSGLLVNNIAKWNGTSWSKLGTQGAGSVVNSLTTWNSGTGNALYVAGLFTSVSGIPANRVAMWNGIGWSGLTSGLNNDANVVLGSNGGPIGTYLYTGGLFSTAGGPLSPASNIARWTGTFWTSVGAGLNGKVLDLAILDEGSGPVLMAGGEFDAANGTAVNQVARWNGTGWSSVGAGTNDTVRALLSTDETNAIGRALYVGGQFTQANNTTANRIARWVCSVTIDDCTGDGRFDLDDFARWDDCDNGPNGGFGSSNCDCLDRDEDGDLDLRDYATFQRIFAGP
ncbi:MAG: hypothetical protein J5J06_17530 [Phycisphaerae bacterium]|nr:hypothetical protein [Phycisphaerae bacterium]